MSAPNKPKIVLVIVIWAGISLACQLAGGMSQMEPAKTATPIVEPLVSASVETTRAASNEAPGTTPEPSPTSFSQAEGSRAEQNPLAPLPPAGPFQCERPRLNDLSSSGRFNTGSEDYGAWGTSEGEYYLEMKKDGSWLWRSDGLADENAVYEVDVRQSQPGPGAFGLVFGCPNLDAGDSFYNLMLNDQGEYALFLTVDHDRRALIDFHSTDRLFPPDQVNHIRVARSGDMIGLYVNGMPLASAIQDATFTGKTYAGFIAWSNEKAGLKASYDNYSVCQLDKPLGMPLFVSKDVQRDWPENQPVDLIYLWETKTSEQASQFAALLETNLVIDGVTYTGLQEYWGKVQAVGENYFVEWKLPLPAFPAGAHVIEYSNRLTGQITDGFDSNKDGKEDQFGPGEMNQARIELNVAGASPVSPATPASPAAEKTAPAPAGKVIPGSKKPFETGGLKIQIAQVEYGEPYAGMFTPADMKPDQTVLTVIVDVLPGVDMKAVGKLSPWTSDASGSKYLLGAGLSHSEPTPQVIWLFAVPKNASSFYLNFPGGEVVDLAPLMR